MLNRRYIRSGFVLLACWLAAGVLAAQEKGKERDRYAIDLATIGYPEPIHDSRWRGVIDFVDSERLLITFPTDKPGPEARTRGAPSHYRAVAIDFSGKVLHSQDSSAGVGTGPDGHFLRFEGDSVLIFDSDFSLLQTIPAKGTEVTVDPARKGFMIDDRNGFLSWHVSYYSGEPAAKTQESTAFCDAIVVEGGYVCFDSNHPERSAMHVDANAPQPDLRNKIALEHPGLEDNPDKKWLKPGNPASVGWGRRRIASSGRAMYTTFMTLLPITDTFGFGDVIRVLVMDIKTKRTIFRKEYGQLDDVALSPDGKWFAVRQGTRLTVLKLKDSGRMN